MTTYILSFEDGRDTPPYDTLEEAIDAAGEDASGQAWVIGEAGPDRAPRTVARGLPATGQVHVADEGALVRFAAAGRDDLVRLVLGVAPAAAQLRPCEKMPPEPHLRTLANVPETLPPGFYYCSLCQRYVSDA